MKVKMKSLRSYSDDGKKVIKCLTGETYDVSDFVGGQWVAQGDAVEVKAKKAKK